MSAQDFATSTLAKPVTLAEDWAALPANSEDWATGQRLGPYRLQRRLGKGGMGVVWLAEQLTPLQRDVAIKLLPRNQHNALSEIYFEVERQALAQLSHRSIAQIYDAGRLPDGAMFFAMEYVAGAPLDVFLQEQRLSLPAIIGLLIQICLGAHHAHQRALIHRDLKPLNIMVQMVDGAPLPKIIDFGIAIGILPGSSARLEAGKAIGTPAYMSPEQKTPGPAGIDARSDVYSLGAILAQCLCWHVGVSDSTQAIASTQLRENLQCSLARAAAKPQLGFPMEKLRAMPIELRAIALRALAVDRDQRYDSAADLAEDLDHWLNKRPVRAMGNSRSYTLRCFINRNRLATAAIAAIALALLVGALLAMHGLDRAREARALAEQRRDDAERLIQFMLGDFADKLRPINRLDLLDSVGSEALAYLSAQVRAADASSALNRARALRTLGEVRVTRQQFELAAAPLEQAATLLRPWLIPTSSNADVYFEFGTIAYWRGTIAYRQSQLDQAQIHWQAYLDAAQQLKAVAPQDPRANVELASALNNLGTLAEGRNQFSKALGYFKQSAAILESQIRGPGDRTKIELVNSLSWISRIHNNLADPARAWIALERALQLVSELREYEDDNQLRQRETTLRYMLGVNSVYRGDLERARLELTQALQLARLDVQNDPSQPRRLAMLARISFELVRANQKPSEGQAILGEGQMAMASLSKSALNSAELLALQARACLARLAMQPGTRNFADCETQVLPQMLQSAVNEVDMIELAGEVAVALAIKRPGKVTAVHMSTIANRLRELPSHLRKTLRHLIVVHALYEQIDPQSAEILEIGEQIDRLRASFNHQPEGV